MSCILLRHADCHKPDLRKIAQAYGNGATYHTMEGFSRKIKAKADARIKEMKEEGADGGVEIEIPKARGPRKSKIGSPIDGGESSFEVAVGSLHTSATTIAIYLKSSSSSLEIPQ